MPLPPTNATTHLTTRPSANNAAGKVEAIDRTFRGKGLGCALCVHSLCVLYPPPLPRMDNDCQIGWKGERTVGEMFGGGGS